MIWQWSTFRFIGFGFLCRCISFICIQPFQFQINGQGISYKFDHYGDRGSGAKSRHLAIFDVAMLRHTPLPFLIHDSAIIKLV